MLKIGDMAPSTVDLEPLTHGSLPIPHFTAWYTPLSQVISENYGVRLSRLKFMPSEAFITTMLQISAVKIFFPLGNRNTRFRGFSIFVGREKA